jgi:hypothetical protein
MHGSISKIPSKKSRQVAMSGGFNSDVKGLMNGVEMMCKEDVVT